MNDVLEGEVFPPVLDACCGPRMMWFDPSDSRALFMDCREETIVIERGPGSIGRKPCVISPDIKADFTKMPFQDETFDLVVFDPPHIKGTEARAKGVIGGKYGVLLPGWEEVLKAGFEECFRVLRQRGTLIFKWNETEIPLKRVLGLTPEKPLFGHRTGKHMKTHWVVFMKLHD